MENFVEAGRILARADLAAYVPLERMGFKRSSSMIVSQINLWAGRTLTIEEWDEAEKGYNEVYQAANIKTGIERTPERTCFLADVVVTAVEGGIGYWCEHRNYQWTQDGETRDMTSASVEVREYQDGGRWRPVTLETIEDGITKIREASFTINPEVLSFILVGDRNNDAGEIDSTAADCIIQAALLGELVYG